MTHTHDERPAEGEALHEAPSGETRMQTHARARTCHAEIVQVLERHRCRIVAVLTAPEPVGTDGSRALIGATYGIVPDQG